MDVEGRLDLVQKGALLSPRTPGGPAPYLNETMALEKVAHTLIKTASSLANHNEYLPIRGPEIVNSSVTVVKTLQENPDTNFYEHQSSGNQFKTGLDFINSGAFSSA